MPFRRKVVSLQAWRDRDTAALIAHLQKRLEAGDLGGLIVQSINKKGKERTHMTGIYDMDREKAAGAILKLSIQMTAARGGFDDAVGEE
jgi:hypothetical protein